MKCFFTQTMNDGILTIRQAIGGAGYSAWSGMAQLIDNSNPCVTFEGDNTLLAKQSAKLIQKMHKRVT